MEDIPDKILILILVFGSVILHEIAHGYVAWRLGDPTARMQGRLTLNPLAHIDLFGTILVPLMLSFSGAPVLGWAKPVPFNPTYFQDPKRGIMLTGAAGPATNFAIALLAAFLIHLLLPFVHLGFVGNVLYALCTINIYLGLFNLLPVPPLDGSRVVVGLIPREWVSSYLSLERFGFLILIGLIASGIVGKILDPLERVIIRLLFMQ